MGSGETDQGQAGSLRLRCCVCVRTCVCARYWVAKQSVFLTLPVVVKTEVGRFLFDRRLNLSSCPLPRLTCILAAWMLLVSVAGSGTFGRVCSVCGLRACEAWSC